ncbi:MAG: 50S ribosomal protein L18 [Thermodesulfobacteriota bacterium]|nr:50S ribosomal protein L18 [Thermodesulfobacteriota bacterium]
MGSLNIKKQARLKRKKRIRKNLAGSTQRPRLSVFRSAKHVYAQIIDDTSGHTIAAASTVEKDVKEHFAVEPSKGKVIAATYVGKLIAKRAAEKGIQQVVFDRNGFLFHGRVKAVSESAREAGLNF